MSLELLMSAGWRRALVCQSKVRMWAKLRWRQQREQALRVVGVVLLQKRHAVADSAHGREGQGMCVAHMARYGVIAPR